MVCPRARPSFSPSTNAYCYLRRARMPCYACGVDAARVRELEIENDHLRSRVEQLMTLYEPKASALVEAPITPAEVAVVAPNDQTLQPACTTSHISTSQASTQSAVASIPLVAKATRPSTFPRVVRGFTAAGLAEAAEEEEAASDFEVSVSDAPQRCDEVSGACTIVRVHAPNRPGLLVAISQVLAGVDLTVARAVIQTSQQGRAANEFWVQQQSAEGAGPVAERVKRRAIEQRLRRWSAGKQLDSAALPLSSQGGLGDLGGERPV